MSAAREEKLHSCLFLTHFSLLIHMVESQNHASTAQKSG